MSNACWLALGLGLLALAPRVSSGQAAPPTAAEEMKQIQGTWQLLYSETNGKPAPVDLVKSIHVNIGEGRHEVWIGEEKLPHEITFTLDPSTSPKSTTDTLHGGEDDGKQIQGIYQLDGDSLISCTAEMGKDRPTKFETAPGTGHTLRVFARVKPGEGPEQKAIREEYIRFGGTWTYEAMEVNGQKLPPMGANGPKLVIMGNRFKLASPEATYAGTYKIDPLASPKTIETMFVEGPEKGKTAQGIYELDGDTYRVCVGLKPDHRPKELKAPAGSGDAMQVLKRQKPQ